MAYESQICLEGVEPIQSDQTRNMFSKSWEPFGPPTHQVCLPLLDLVHIMFGMTGVGHSTQSPAGGSCKQVGEVVGRRMRDRKCSALGRKKLRMGDQVCTGLERHPKHSAQCMCPTLCMQYPMLCPTLCTHARWYCGGPDSCLCVQFPSVLQLQTVEKHTSRQDVIDIEHV